MVIARVGYRRSLGRRYPTDGVWYRPQPPAVCPQCGGRRWRAVAVLVARDARPWSLGTTGTTTRRTIECVACGSDSWYWRPRRIAPTPPQPLHPGLASRKHDPTRAKARAAKHRAHQGKERR